MKMLTTSNKKKLFVDASFKLFQDNPENVEVKFRSGQNIVAAAIIVFEKVKCTNKIHVIFKF